MRSNLVRHLVIDRRLPVARLHRVWQVAKCPVFAHYRAHNAGLLWRRRLAQSCVDVGVSELHFLAQLHHALHALLELLGPPQAAHELEMRRHPLEALPDLIPIHPGCRAARRDCRAGTSEHSHLAPGLPCASALLLLLLFRRRERFGRRRRIRLGGLVCAPERGAQAAQLRDGRRRRLVVALGTVRDHARRDAEERRVKRQHALHVGEEQAAKVGNLGLLDAVLGVDGLLGGDAEQRLDGHDAAHGVPDEHGADRRLNRWRGRSRRNLQIDDFLLQPENNTIRAASSCRQEGLRFHSPRAEAHHALAQVALGLILGIHQHLDVNFGQLLGDQIPQMLRKLVVFTKREVAALVHTRHY